MKRILFLAAGLLLALPAEAGEFTPRLSHSIRESKKHGFFVAAYDTTNATVTTPSGALKIKEAWLEKSTRTKYILGVFSRRKIDNKGYNIILTFEEKNNTPPVALALWLQSPEPPASISFQRTSGVHRMRADARPPVRLEIMQTTLSAPFTPIGTFELREKN